MCACGFRMWNKNPHEHSMEAELMNNRKGTKELLRLIKAAIEWRKCFAYETPYGGKDSKKYYEFEAKTQDELFYAIEAYEKFEKQFKPQIRITQ